MILHYRRVIFVVFSLPFVSRPCVVACGVDEIHPMVDDLVSQTTLGTLTRADTWTPQNAWSNAIRTTNSL